MPSYFSLKIRTNITIIFELGHQSALSPQETSPPKYEKAGFQHRLERILCFFEKLRRPAIKPGPRSYLLLSPSPTPVPHTPTNVFQQPGKSLPPSRSPCPGPIQHMGKNRVANQICNPVLLFCGRRGIRTPGTLQFNGFQDRRDRPLRHPSGHKSSTDFPFRQIFTPIYRPYRRAENQIRTIIFVFIRNLHIFVSELGPRGYFLHATML